MNFYCWINKGVIRDEDKVWVEYVMQNIDVIDQMVYDCFVRIKLLKMQGGGDVFFVGDCFVYVC